MPALPACGVGAQLTLVDTSGERLLGSAARPGQQATKPAAAAATRRAG